MVSSGRLDQPIRIERATRTRNAYGEFAVTGWALVAEPFAKVVTALGREIVAGARDVETNTVAFLVRDGLDVTTADRIIWEARAFDIIAINPAPRRGEVTIEARQVNDASGE